MTNIDQLSGRDLDAAIAEKLFGWRWETTAYRSSNNTNRASANAVALGRGRGPRNPALSSLLKEFLTCLRC